MWTADLAGALDPAVLLEAAGNTPDRWQERVLRSNASRQLLLCCRQAGKSTVSAALALHEALYRPRALVLVLAPSLRQSQELFRKVHSVYRCLPYHPRSDLESTLRLELEKESGRSRMT